MKIYDQGVPLQVTGVGVPKGGKSGQILVKKSDDDYDTYWADLKDFIDSIAE